MSAVRQTWRKLHLDELPLGKMAIASVRPSHIRAWLKDRRTVLAESTLAVLWADVATMRLAPPKTATSYRVNELPDVAGLAVASW